MAILGPGAGFSEERLAAFQDALLCPSACVVPQMMKCSMKGSAYQMSDEQRHPTPEDLGRYGLEVTLQDLSIELCLMGQQDLSYQRSWY